MSHVPSPVLSPAHAIGLQPRRLLSVEVSGQRYAVDLMQVCEIRQLQTPGSLAAAPGGLRGSINLRGELVPIIDLRAKLGGDLAPDASIGLVVVEAGGRVVGLVVHKVCDVIELPDEAGRPSAVVHDGIDVTVLDVPALLQDGRVVSIVPDPGCRARRTVPMHPAPRWVH